MATIMERIGLIVRSEATDLRERFEDPEKAINQTIADAMVALANLKKDATTVFEGEEQARRQVEPLVDQANRWHNVARHALAAGNEADARTALSREQDIKERLVVYQGIYDQAHEVAETYRARVAEIEDGISQLQAQMARIKAKEATARATEMSAQLSGGSGTLDARETAADWELATAEGTAEAQRLTENPFAALEEAAAAERARQDAAPVNPAEVDAALAALRAQLETDDDDEDEDDD